MENCTKIFMFDLQATNKYLQAIYYTQNQWDLILCTLMITL